MAELALLLATISTALVAGLYAAFAYAVMPGLRRESDDVLVATMRAVNRAILNPVFLLLFLGPLLLGPLGVWWAWDAPAVRWWALGGTVLYAVSFVVTAAANVPLNEALDRGERPADVLRDAFEVPWTRWNVLRAVVTVAAASAFAVSLLQH